MNPWLKENCSPFWLKPLPLENADEESPPAVMVDPMGEITAGVGEKQWDMTGTHGGESCGCGTVLSKT